jgi:endonuclease G
MHRRTLRVLVVFGCVLLLLCARWLVLPSQAQTSSIHLTMGNPSNAVADVAAFDNYLIVRNQYALSYHRDRGIPNWVSWRLAKSDLGDTPRYTGQFITDTTLPDGWYRVRHADYTLSGYDRGHMVPSADRTDTAENNRATFILTNVLPQAPENNQQPWAQLESLARDLARIDNELYIIAGSYGSRGTLADGRLTIPEITWKVIMVLPDLDGDDVARVDADTQVFGVWMPNDARVVQRNWDDYALSVRCIEQRTGLNFFAEVDPALQDLIEGAPCEPTSVPSPTPTGEANPEPTPPSGSPNPVYMPLLQSAAEPPIVPTPTVEPTATQQPSPTVEPTATQQPSPTSIPSLPPSFNNCQADTNAGQAPNVPVRIVSIDKFAETVSLRNESAETINLTGWVMCSIRGNQRHPISGELAPGQTRVFPGPISPIWSNSERDDGALYDPQGRLVSYWFDR